MTEDKKQNNSGAQRNGSDNSFRNRHQRFRSTRDNDHRQNNGQIQDRLEPKGPGSPSYPPKDKEEMFEQYRQVSDVPRHRGYEDMSEADLTFLKSTKIEEDDLLEDFPVYDFDESKTLMDVVGVKLHDSGPVILFDCQDMYLDHGNQVIVETERGMVLGEVMVPARRCMVGEQNLPRVIRKATSNDLAQHTRNQDRQDAAYRLCNDRIERLGLPMKLVKVEYLHGGNKAVFFFSADGRIDFRELVKDLAKRLHTRIEMRQIGVRDASRMLGGIGICGCTLCCNLYLREFQPVSIRMAKEQNLVLHPQKVSGICGRLLCCLIYEDEVYREGAKGIPKVGRQVMTPDGLGRVKDRDVLTGIIRVQLGDSTTLTPYSVKDITPADGRSGEKDDEAQDLEESDTDIPNDLNDVIDR